MNNEGWFAEVLRTLFGSIDYVIYKFISWVMASIFNLSNLTLNGDLANTLYNRVYVVLSIFMVFKLSFSFLKYIISPDMMSDKEQGVGKLIARTITMLGLVVFLPLFFFKTDWPLLTGGKTLLSNLQDGVILTLPRIIFGRSPSSKNIAKNARNDGEQIALMMLSSFYYDAACEDNDPDCDVATAESKLASLNDFRSSLLIVSPTNKGIYMYNYMWPLTTVSGVVLIIILLGIAIDVAIRVFKLLILQIMAPVPIMSYIDPKSSKDGAFASWVKSFVSTYIDIFVKLGSVYLVIMLLSVTFNGDLFGQTDWDNVENMGFLDKTFIYVFLTIGLFKFAKDAPKFIKDALGIKDSGGGGGFMGKALAGMAGAAAGFAGGVTTGGLAGGLSGLTTGYSAGLAGKGGQAYSQVRDQQAKLLGKTPGGVRGKLQNKAMQHSVMKHTGLNKDTLKAAKADMIEKQNRANELLYQYQNDPKSVDYNEVMAAQAAAAKAQSTYNDANSLAGQIGLKPNFFEENKRHGVAYRAVNRVVSGHNGVDNLRDVSISSVKDKIEKSYYDKRYDNADQVISAKHDYDAAKDDYKRTLSGGFGASSSSVSDAKFEKDLQKYYYKHDKKSNK